MVRCQKCGSESPEGTKVCSACGSTLEVGVRYCVSCGRSVDLSANVCPYCGHDFRVALAAPARESLSTGMRVLLYLVSVFVWIAGIIIGIVFMTKDDPEYKRVGKICLILGIVSILISVGLAAALYLMVLGFGGTPGPSATPIAVMSDTPTVDGVKVTFMSVSEEVPWSDVTLLLSDNMNFAAWHPVSSDLTGTVFEQEDYGSDMLGSLIVSLTVTDLAGNGVVDGGDYFVLTSSPSFSAVTTYTVTIVWEPSDGNIGMVSFSG